MRPLKVFKKLLREENERIGLEWGWQREAQGVESSSKVTGSDERQQRSVRQPEVARFQGRVGMQGGPAHTEPSHGCLPSSPRF